MNLNIFWWSKRTNKTKLNTSLFWGLQNNEIHINLIRENLRRVQDQNTYYVSNQIELSTHLNEIITFYPYFFAIFWGLNKNIDVLMGLRSYVSELTDCQHFFSLGWFDRNFDWILMISKNLNFASLSKQFCICGILATCITQPCSKPLGVVGFCSK